MLKNAVYNSRKNVDMNSKRKRKFYFSIDFQTFPTISKYLKKLVQISRSFKRFFIKRSKTTTYSKFQGISTLKGPLS